MCIVLPGQSIHNGGGQIPVLQSGGRGGGPSSHSLSAAVRPHLQAGVGPALQVRQHHAGLGYLLLV